jgi:hypothetical protein
MQVGQILGQFASATPMAIVIALKVFERSFDGIVMTAEDWEQLYQSIAMQLQRGSSAAGPSEGGEEQPTKEGEEEKTDINDDPQFKQMVDKAVSQGVPKGKAEAMIRDKLAEQENTSVN